MLKNHSMSLTQAFLLDCFLQMAKLLTIAFSSVPFKQFIMDNPLHIPPDAGPSASDTHVKIALLETRKPFWASFQQ
jgi:hypothetical protein